MKTVWLVRWTRAGAKEYGTKPNEICAVGNEEWESMKVKCKCHESGWHYGNSLAVFDTKKEAKEWRITS